MTKFCPVLWPLFLVLAACQHPAKQSEKPGGDPGAEDSVPRAPIAWTDAFMGPALIFAEEIEIEGPEGILTHCAVQNVLDDHEATARTTSDGLLQETRLKPGRQNELHAWLDHWELVAFRKVTILERVVPCDVRIRARGDVRFVDQTTHQEKHGAVLSFEGKIRR